jgi:transcription initiation factor TFIIIB Brf1 subunit/transcription initiation factor TFIIB
VECFCEQKQTNEIKVEADFCADPIWCKKCGCVLDLHLFTISSELKNDLMNGMLQYGEWINFETDTLVENGIKLEDKHNEIGINLTDKVKKEVGHKYKITFIPSSSARTYANKDKLF